MSPVIKLCSQFLFLINSSIFCSYCTFDSLLCFLAVFYLTFLLVFTIFTQQPFSSDVTLGLGSSNVILLCSWPQYKHGESDKPLSSHCFLIGEQLERQRIVKNLEGHQVIFQAKATHFITHQLLLHNS